MSFVAVVPVLLLLCMAGLQAGLAGYTAIVASQAARAAARAAYVGEDVDRAARAALPSSFRGDAEVEARGGVAEVSLTAPRVLPLGPRIPVDSKARFGPSSEAVDG